MSANVSHKPFAIRDLRANLATAGPTEAAAVAAEALDAFTFMAAQAQYHAVELVLAFGDLDRARRMMEGFRSYVAMIVEAEQALADYFPAALVAYRRHFGATLH